MFSVASIFLVAFALNLQDAVYGTVTTAVTSFPSTTPANLTGLMTTTSSPTQTLGAIVATPTAAASTSGTSSESTGKTSSETNATSTTGTTSSSSVTIAQSTATPSSEKTCASVTATLKEAKQKENVTEILRQFLVSEPSKYSDLNVTNLNVNDEKVSFTFCVKIDKDGKIESDTEDHLKRLLIATVVDINILGVEITDVEVVDKCKKCSDGGGGPFDIKGKCQPKKHSCNGVEGKMKSTDCSKHCSGVASFMASYLLVSMGIALSLSFYL